MRHKDLFKTYVWLVETLHRHGPLALEEIDRLWRRSALGGGNPLARTTFNRHREEIEDVFGIRIVCDRSAGCRYAIEDAGRTDCPTAQTWLSRTLALNGLIAENRDVQDRILLEPVPSEGARLGVAVGAMRLGRRLDVGYRKYGCAELSRYEAEPYCVKLYRRRWYLLARRVDTREFRVLSFDRIERLELASGGFSPEEGFDAAAFFGECFGIVRDEGVEPQRVVLRAYGRERFYVRDLPVHPLQRLLDETADYADFEVRLRPTPDFEGFLLSRGAWLQVMEPQWLAESVAGRLEAACRRYGREGE